MEVVGEDEQDQIWGDRDGAGGSGCLSLAYVLSVLVLGLLFRGNEKSSFFIF